jgi:protein tyrosine phosphatase
MGVKTIVNLRGIHSDRKDLAGLGFKYVHISFKPWHPEDEDAVAFLEVMTKKGNQPVFVHCKKGVDRTGTMVALYRVVFEGWPMAAAIEEMHQFGRHSVWSNLDHYLRKVDVEALKRKLATDVRQGAEMAEAGIAE